MSARTTPKYEEELFGVKEENEQHFQPLDDVCEQPRIVLHKTDVGEKYLRPDQEDMKPPNVKEEEEHPDIEEEEKPVRVKEEEVEDDVTKLPPTFAPLKSEDEDKDVAEKYLHPDQEDMKPPNVKKEEEHPYIEEEEKPVRVKEEAVEDDVTKLPPTFAPLKSEDEDKAGTSRNTAAALCGAKRVGSLNCNEDQSWKQTHWRPKRIRFTAKPGPQGSAAELESDLPVDFLELFITNELLQHIVDETNANALDSLQENPCGLLYSRSHDWRPLTVEELKTFLGLSFITGFIKKPVLEDYWSDRRTVKMVTTCHQDRTLPVEVWQEGNKEKVTVLKPECVAEYDASMNGVDKLDQNIVYYPFLGRSQVGQGDDEQAVGKQTRAPYMKDPERRLDGQLGRHRLEKLVPTSKKLVPTRRCRVCQRKGLRRETTMCLPLSLNGFSSQLLSG
ncbi:uncharacterized protein LOC144001581 [Festucalex cinctus]